MKDPVGDTALHEAVPRKNDDIINMLIECQDVDFELKNDKGFNVLHQAAICGDFKSVSHYLSYNLSHNCVILVAFFFKSRSV